MIASGGHDRFIHLWNVKTARTVKAIDPDPVWTASLAITPDGKLLASGGATGGPIREYIRLGALPVGYVDRLGASGASRCCTSGSPSSTAMSAPCLAAPLK